MRVGFPYILFSYLVLLVGISVPARADVYMLCPIVRIETAIHERIAFTETEKRLICGAPGDGPWSKIPTNQAIFNIKNFIQDAGYFQPDFTREGDVLVVHAGTPTKVTGLIVNDAPSDVDFTRLRKIIGQRLQPKLLDDVQARVERFLQVKGYACPKVKLNANPITGVITVDVDAGKKLLVLGVNYEPVSGLNTDMLKRYRAFELHEPYNPDFLQVTSNRILDDGILQSTHFSTKCEDDGVNLTERSVPGPPRTVSIGVGLDTEQIAILRASWKNSRLGDYGSQVQVSASASAIQQQLDAVGKWYYLGFLSRHYLRPTLQFKHENLGAVEDIIGSVGLAPALSADSQHTSVTMYGGPTFLLTKTLRGVGPEFSKQLTVAGEIKVTDHYYEFYRTAPRHGYQVTLDGLFAQNNVLSNFTAYRLDLRAEKLWNLAHFDPPLFVLGMRAGYGTTFTPEGIDSNLLATPFRHYLGGSTDLRGFGRQDLAATRVINSKEQQLGMLSEAFLSAELRMVDVLPHGIQPFLFVDSGMLGLEPLKLNQPIFVSPGVGLRVQTQIGVIRSTFSKGYIAGSRDYVLQYPEHYQFYFSFGEEF